MQNTSEQNRPVTRMLVAVALALLVLPETVIAEHQPKTYPEVGKIIAGGLTQHTVNGPPMGSMGNTVQTKYSHTYKVDTERRIYELDCGKVSAWRSTGKGCGGKTPLEIGDPIQFRREKESVYILLPDGSEQKLRILSEELKQESKSGSAKAADVKQ
jgi:hypothetical protein